MYSQILEHFLTFRRIPLRVIAITALTSWALQIGALVQGQPLYIIALYTLLPWIPLFFFESIWKYEHYSWIAVFAIVTGLQVGHLGEHAFQIAELYALNGSLVCPPPVDNAENAARAVQLGLRQPAESPTGYSAALVVKADAQGRPVLGPDSRPVLGPPACGVFGQLDFETIHLVWDTLVWLGALWLLTKFPGNVFLWIAMLAASAHEMEHLFLGFIYFFDTARAFSYTHVQYATTANGAIVTAHPVGLATTPETFYEAGGKQGLLGRNGLVETLLAGTRNQFPIRPLLHFGYNSLVVVPTLVGFLFQVRRVHNAYLAKALPLLTEEQLIRTTPQLERQTFKAGDIVVRQGEVADRFFIITRGQAEVVREEPGGQEIVVGRLGPGQYFGEIGLMHNVKRVATVRAVDELEVLVLDRNEFTHLIEESDITRRELERALRQRVVQIKALKTVG